MQTIGRNRPCPCGSGRKYKLCCGAEELRLRDAAAREKLRTPRSESDLRNYLVRKLFEFAKDTMSQADMDRAWRRFLGTEPELELDGIAETLGREYAEMVELAFHEWLIHDYRPSGEATLIEGYLDRRAPVMLERSRAHLASCVSTVFSAYEVASVDPGRALELTDLLRGGSQRVVERTASRTLLRWDVLVARLIELDGEPVISGAILPLQRSEVAPFLDSVKEGIDRVREERPDGSTDDFLKERGQELMRWVVKSRMEPAPMPELVTFDGEPVVFCRSHYRVLEAAAVREALSSHPDIEPPDAPTVEVAAAGTGSFAWLGEAPEDGAGEARTMGPGDGSILRGSIELEEDDLRLETQSETRLTRLRGLIEDIAGDWVEHRADTIEDVSQAIGRVSDRPRPTPGPADPPPEALEEITREIMTRHYRGWLDEEIPALDGRTPRETVRSESGRARVLEMVKDIENQVDRARRDGEPTWDPGFLREELDLTDA